MPHDAEDDALEAIVQAAERLPYYWATPQLAEVSADGRTVRLDPATQQGAVLWTDQPWVSAPEHVGQPVRFHQFTGVLLIGDERRLMQKGAAPPMDRVKVAPRLADEVERVEMGYWVSGWLGASWMGEPVAGYAQLAEGLVGDVVALFRLDLPEGSGSWNSCPATICFLRYDPARSSVDYIVHIEEFAPSRSLESTVTVDESFEAKIRDSWPAVVFQHLIEANPSLGIFPLSLDQAQEMGWLPSSEDEGPPPFEYLWRPVDLSVD